MTDGLPPLPDRVDTGETVWVWFAVQEGLPDSILMVYIHDREAGGLPALRMLVATDEDTALAFGTYAADAARALGVTAQCRRFRLEQVVETFSPFDPTNN